MSDNPKKTDPAEKKLDSKERPAGWTAEQARDQLVKDSFENRPSKTYEKPPEPPSRSILGTVADWITNTFSSSSADKASTAPKESKDAKQEAERQADSAQRYSQQEKPEAASSQDSSKNDSYKTETAKADASGASKSGYTRGWIGEEPLSAGKSQSYASGWVGEEPQSAGNARSTVGGSVGEEPRRANKAESTVKGWIGEEPQNLMERVQAKAPQNNAWPDETQHGRGAEAVSTGSRSGKAEKTDDKSCTEADSPKTDLNQFPEFFRKHYEKPEPQQQIDPREEQRQEQREMRRAAESGSAQAPQAETPHPASVEMWTKQPPAPGSWDAIESIYGSPSKSKFDGVVHHDVGAGSKGELSQDGKKADGHSSGGSALEQAGDSHGNPSISGKDLSSGSFGGLGGPGKPENGSNSNGSLGRGELGAFGKDGGFAGKPENSSLLPGRTDLGGPGEGKNDFSGKNQVAGLPRHDDTAGGGVAPRTQNPDAGQINSSKSGAIESRLERGDQRQSNVESTRTANGDVNASRPADAVTPKTTDQLQRITSDDQNLNRNSLKNDTQSREFDLPQIIRYVPENKENGPGPGKQVSEQQGLPQTLARISSENRNGEQVLGNGGKRLDALIPEKSLLGGLTELKSTPIVRDFKSGDILPQEFKSTTDATKFIGAAEGRLAANAAKGLDAAVGARGADTAASGALRASEAGLPGALTSRDGRLDQNIFSTKLADVQNSARTIDMLLGSKTEIPNTKLGATDPSARDLIGRDRQDAIIAGRGVKANVAGLREDLIISKIGNEANLSGRADRGFEIASGSERIRAERGLRGERDDLAELRALLDRTSKFSGEKRYLTGVEIALAAAIAAVAVAKTRSEKEIAISQAELAAKQLQELMEDIDLTTPDSDEAEDQVRLPWQADTSADKKRPEYMVAHNDTLLSIAEQFYNDSAVAWLIADINKDRVAEFNEDGKRIIEMRSRQSIELPLWGEVNDFLRNRSELVKTTEIVTIVSQTEVDRELLDSFLSTVIGASSKGEGALGEGLGNLSLSPNEASVARSGSSAANPAPHQVGALARIDAFSDQSFGSGIPAYAGAQGAATMALAVEGNQLTVLLSLGRKLLPSFSTLKKAGMNLQSYVSGRDWQHGGLSRSKDELK